MNTTTRGSSYLVGSNVTLQCVIMKHGTEIVPTMYWTGPVGSENVTALSNTLHLNALLASNAGVYTCHASFGSSNGNESVNLNLNCKIYFQCIRLHKLVIILYTTLYFLVDMDLTLYTNNSEAVRTGDTWNIFCHAKINKSLVDVGVDVDVQLISPQGMEANEYDSTSLGLYERSIIFHNISVQNSGLFLCNATVRPSLVNPYLIPAYRSQDFDLILGK